MYQDSEYRMQLIKEYKEIILPLLRYLPWLEKNAGQNVGGFYKDPECSSHSIAIPVYDSNLMSFVKEAAASPLMERNYAYVYTRGRIVTHDDERRVIANAELKDWDILRGILSKYVMGGRTKASLWTEVVRENIYLLVLQKMQEIVEYWDKPMDIR